ncbi:MAG: ABC transporter permease [Lachnospiraceae bacterium]|nr:ABC transporter permease [Lachnospiraceae bacterium]
MSSDVKAPIRDLTAKDKFKLSKFLVKWEMVLVYILIIINIVLMISKPELYFSNGTIQAIIESGMDLSMLVLAMIFVLMLGDIDVSVASTMVLAAMVTGLSMDAGIPALLCVLLGIATGAVCGAFNGFFVAYMGLPAVIVTIATQMLFRGIVKIVLDVNVLKNFPTFYTQLAWGDIAGIPVSMICFLLISVVFIFILHKTAFGRKLYMIGNNATVTTYSGISVEKTKMIVFILMGVMAGVASIFFVGRMGGGISSSMGTGYELDAIAICVLGGISTNGGKGKVYGPIIATFIMAFLIYTLGLMGVDANSRKILTGVILIVAVLIPNINRTLFANLKLKFWYGNNKNIEAINFKLADDVKVLKEKITAVSKDATLSNDSKAEKIKEYNEKIASAKKKCAETTAVLRAETKDDAAKAKQRFAK